MMNEDSMPTTITIATRKSPLALWQAEFVKAELEKHHAHLEVRLLPMSTRGDKILDTPLAKIGGKGLFIKELEVAMLEGRADIAVHSMKDVPMSLPDGLRLASICERAHPGDALVSNHFASFADLPQGARLGTSSLRRSSQLRASRPDLEILDCRGNVNTRLSKLDAGEFDAIVLAVAGLNRLDMADRIRETIDRQLCLPAPGQGAVGIECRNDDVATIELLSALNNQQTAAEVVAERALNRRLEGGCQVPIAAFAETQGEQLWLRGRVASLDGTQLLKSEARAACSDAETLGLEVAEALLAQGAGAILSSAATHG